MLFEWRRKRAWQGNRGVVPWNLVLICFHVEGKEPEIYLDGWNISVGWNISWLEYQLVGISVGWNISWLEYQLVGISVGWNISWLEYQLVVISVGCNISWL